MSQFISKSHSHSDLLEKLQELHIPKFKAQREKILSKSNLPPNEHEASKLIILLGNINTKFNYIEKLIYNSPHKIDFFKNNLTEQLENSLKAVREELNKLECDSAPNQLDFKSSAPRL